MKQRYLVAYDYGMGGLWGYVLASSPEEVTERFPELVVVDEEPAWVTDEIRAGWEARIEEIDDPTASGLLASIQSERDRPDDAPPSG